MAAHVFGLALRAFAVALLFGATLGPANGHHAARRLPEVAARLGFPSEHPQRMLLHHHAVTTHAHPAGQQLAAPAAVPWSRCSSWWSVPTACRCRRWTGPRRSPPGPCSCGGCCPHGGRTPSPARRSRPTRRPTSSPPPHRSGPRCLWRERGTSVCDEVFSARFTRLRAAVPAALLNNAPVPIHARERGAGRAAMARLALAISVLASLAACGRVPGLSSGRPLVVASTTVLADFARRHREPRAGGARTRSATSPRPRTRLLSRANLYLANGLFYQPFAGRLLDAMPSVKTVTLSDGLTTRESVIDHGDHGHRFANSYLYLNVR